MFTFISSLPLLFPSLHLLPPPRFVKWSPLCSPHHFRAEGGTSTSCSTHTFRRGTWIEADGAAAGRNETRSVWRLYYTCHFRANGATSASCSRHTFYRGTDRSRRSNGGPQRDEQRIITCIGAIEAKIQDTKYFPSSGTKTTKRKIFFFILREKFFTIHWCWCAVRITAGEWRLRAVALVPWEFPAWHERKN